MEHKPLSDLAKNHHHARHIFRFVTKTFGQESTTPEIKNNDDHICISQKSPDFGFTRYVFINFSGSIEHSWGINEEDPNERNNEPIENIFDLVDYIRSLGYEAKNHK